MRKLKLTIDDLQVDSFSVTGPGAKHGTVHGHLPTGEDPDFTVMLCGTAGTCVGPTYCCPVTWKATCPASCYQTGECGDSCNTWWWCGTCYSCERTCDEAGASCTYVCYNCPV